MKCLVIAFLFLSACAQLETKKMGRVEVNPQKTKVQRIQIPSNLTAEQMVSQGHRFYKEKEFNKAFDYYITASEQNKDRAKDLEIKLWALRSSIRANRHIETLDLSGQVISNPNELNETQLLEVTNYRIRSFEYLSDYLGALETIETALSQTKLAKDHTAFKIKGQDFIDSKLNEDQLKYVSEKMQILNYKASALFRLADIAIDKKDLDTARKNYSMVNSLAPNSDLGARALDMLSQLDSLRRVEPKNIGVVLPLTGKYNSISQKTLRGIEMGLGLYGANPSPYKLSVIDSEGSPDQARRGVEKMVKEDHVIAVIGSLLSKTANAVAAKTLDLGVPSIALSQKAGITEVGSTVFRNSMTSQMQVRELVRTAMEDLGLKKFAILYPNDQYGVEFTNLFWDEVRARGGLVTAIQTYSDKETDFKEPIQRLVGTYYIEARADEYKMHLQEWAEAQTKKSARNSPPEDLLPPIVDFEAIFIPDNVKAMGQISAMLSFNNVKSIYLLGTNIWNSPQLSKRAGANASQLVFVDSFISSDQRFIQSEFVRDYKSLFNEEPGIFEIQGYDSALMLRHLITAGNSSRESLTKALNTLKDLPGSVGKLTVNEDREIIRPVMALSVSNGNIVPFKK